MDQLKILLRSFFKRGKNSLVKITSLSVGLALGLVMVAEVYFEQSYDNFFPDKERIYQVLSSNYSTGDGFREYPQTPGGVVIGMKNEMPEVEVVTRYTWLSGDAALTTPDKNKYYGNVILGDSCLFDVFPRPVLAGNPKEVLARPMYAMISNEMAEKFGGVAEVIGKTFEINSRPGKILTIGGVFEKLPNNTHLKYDVVVSMSSIGQYMWDGSLNWVGNDRYVSYVKLYPGIHPESLRTGLEKMKEKYLPLDEIEKSGVSIDWVFKPLIQIHTGDETTKRMVLTLSILAGVLLFTAVMNYILIVISSLVNRSREMAVNKCYGASGKNIYFRVFSETGIDLFISLLIAFLLVLFFRGTILSLLGTSLSDLFTVKSVLLLLTVCLLVFFVAAFVPGYLYARIPVAAAFRNFPENKRYWKLGLLFTQFIAAGFFVTLLMIIDRQYRFMLNDDPGYAYDNLVYTNLSGVDRELRQKALEEIKRLPNVKEATTSSALLFNGVPGNSILLPDDERELFNIADLEYVGDGYLKIMDIPVIEGRSFIENIPSSREVMVSRRFVEKMKNYTNWPDGSVGKNLRITYHSQTAADVFTICGVYEDFRLGVIGGQDLRPTVLFYSDKPSTNLLVKFHRETPEAIQEVDDKLKAMMPDKDVIVYSYTGEMKNRYIDTKNFTDSLLIGGLVTLVICLMGLIGYTNDEGNRRRKETAIRKVNGATSFDVQWLFLKDISCMALPAITIGCVVAYFVADSWLKRFADKAELSFLLFIGCSLAVLLIILAAVGLRSYRAVNENPAESVKSE